MNRDNVPAKSNSGIVSDRAMAVALAETTPSTPVRVMNCCMFGVSRNGTVSLEEMTGWPGANAALLASDLGIAADPTYKAVSPSYTLDRSYG